MSAAPLWLRDVDLPGALGGSRLLGRPEHAPAVAAWQARLAAGGPVLVEIGFDHGRRLTATAAAHPGWQVLGLEVRARRVEEANAWAAAHGLTNLHAWHVDARTALAAATPDASIDVLEALFPTPQPVHVERTLLTTAFFDEAARVLKPGGVLHLATDVAPYAEDVAARLRAHAGLRIEAEAAADRPPITQLSRREWRCERDGVPVWRWWCRRVEP